MQFLVEEITIKGSPICRGIAIGKSYFLKREEIPVTETYLTAKQSRHEIERYRLALSRCWREIKSLQKQLESELASEGVLILESQLEMLSDPLLTSEIEKKILSLHKNAEFVLQQTIVQLKDRCSTIEDPSFSERYRELLDLTQRVLSILHENSSYSFNHLPPQSIVCAKELTATDVAGANPYFVGAFITETGGATSHAAIIAKAKGIPFITNIKLSTLQEYGENCFIVDGRLGKVIINPGDDVLKSYEKLKSQMLQQNHDYQKAIHWPSQTYDGYQVRLYANLEMTHELELVHQLGGEGVGLFRSEYIFFPKNRIPPEEEQYRIYADLVKNMKGRPIVIRTFDFGGDKASLPTSFINEKNPFLGSHAARFLLRDEALFKTQLRAILRASEFGNVSILFPMISTVLELKEAKRMVLEVCDELKLKNKIRIGCMIEVPSAAMIVDHFAKECDFLSIGTNDLVQYSLAVDRRDHQLSEYYEPTDPSIVRLLRLITSEANKAQIPVSVCGEIASDPRFTPLLLGLGIQELSVAPRHLPVIKNAIRNTSIVDAVYLVERILNMVTAKEIMNLLVEEYRKNVPSDLYYNMNLCHM
ncbi:MAG: phosphoenolpyruvate--protein phosphotransferase [Chlamydiales bacterium]